MWVSWPRGSVRQRGRGAGRSQGLWGRCSWPSSLGPLPCCRPSYYRSWTRPHRLWVIIIAFVFFSSYWNIAKSYLNFLPGTLSIMQSAGCSTSHNVHFIIYVLLFFSWLPENNSKIRWKTCRTMASLLSWDAQTSESAKLISLLLLILK